MLDTGCSMLNARCWMVDAGAGPWFQVSEKEIKNDPAEILVKTHKRR